MSWFASATNVRSGAEVPDPTNVGEEGVAAQVAIAKAIATSLVESGAVGDGSKTFQINLSGHANPSHEPRAGYVNDTVTVTVNQMTPNA